MSCISCAQLLCEECPNVSNPIDGDDTLTCCCNGSNWEEYYASQIGYGIPLSGNSSNAGAGRGRPQLDDKDVKDPRSTMRKRAQKVLKQVRNVEIGGPCEWRGLVNCGGGNHPIEGCTDGTVAHIHHGPDKDWYKNTPTNLHGLCHTCHNRWHAANDNDYDPRIPHNPVKRDK